MAAITLVAAVPDLTDAGLLGWLEVPIAPRLLLHLPLAVAVAAGCPLVLEVFGWTVRRRSCAVRFRYRALTVASVALVAQVGTWGRIGWGLP